MSLSLEQIVGRVGDSTTPVVWLDPSCPESIWQALPEALARLHYGVWDLDAGMVLDSEQALVGRWGGLLGRGEDPPRDMGELRTALAAWPQASAPGRVVLFRQPEALRQAEEAVFEEFLETLATVDELWRRTQRGALKLVVRD